MTFRTIDTDMVSVGATTGSDITTTGVARRPVFHRVLRYLSGERYQPLRVALPHSPIAPLNVYKRFFHAEVMIDQQHAALYFHKDMLNITLDNLSSTKSA